MTRRETDQNGDEWFAFDDVGAYLMVDRKANKAIVQSDVPF
jgi:hypothetical protein